ncbi:hypothetical protein AURDEDRAFT_27789, partial [Auricularia subglabra TFB-10046 SS5]
IPVRSFAESDRAVKYVPAWFPGAGFKRQAREWKEVADAMLNDPFAVTKKAM